MPEADLEAALDRLYTALPADFVATRAALVKELRPLDRDLASDIGSRRKPSQSAWAINQLQLDDGGQLAPLSAAGERLREAVRQGAKREEQEQARRQRAAAIAAACVAGLDRIRAAGMVPAAATEGRLTRSLEAIAAYGSELPGPPPGRMDADLEPPGFELLAGFDLRQVPPRATASERSRVPSAPRDRAPRRRAQQRPPRADAVERAAAGLQAADAELARSEAEMEAAESALEELRQELEDSKLRVAAARRRRDSARRERERIRRELAKLKAGGAGSS